MIGEIERNTIISNNDDLTKTMFSQDKMILDIEILIKSLPLQK